MALSVPLSRFTSRVGGGSAFFVRHQATHQKQHNKKQINMNTTPEVTNHASKRYTDAYLVARTIIKVGGAVKIVGVVLAIVVIIAGIVLQANGRADGVALGGFVLGFVIGIPISILGILLSAQGQVLQANLDSAVHTSPFLDDNQKAKTMSLQ